MTDKPRLILASNSPRRRQLLALTGMPFTVSVADVDESQLANENPAEYVLRLAETKARPVRGDADQFVLAADTTVVDRTDILGKPRDEAEALAMLTRLRGHTHQVYTGIALLRAADGVLLTDLCVTDVPMRDYTDEEMHAYVASGDPKTRKEVRGGGKKPCRQKGTGQARMGTTRSPLRRGGGTIFGPHPRDYSAKVPRQMKRLAIQSVFSDKARKECIKVLDKIEMSEAKTKAVVGMLTKLAVAGKKCLILDEGKNETVHLSCRNLPKVTYQPASLANGYEVLNADYVIFTKAGLAKAEEVFA